MKYIRTKDGRILELTGYSCKNRDGVRCFGTTSNRYSDQIINGWNILDQANTIEELIDEYVLVEKSARCFLNYDEITEDDLKLCLQDHDIFGAIWTDKGLIYVAKMNEKGELELL